MNKIIPLLSALLCTGGMVSAKVDPPRKLEICRQLMLSIFEETTEAGKPLPTSWDQLPGVHAMAEWKRDGLAAFDFLVIVPGAPVIGGGDAAARGLEGRRLFAMSRTPDYLRKTGFFGEHEAAGRYIITFTENAAGSFAMWIPETQAQAIIRQTGFQPEKQPTASGKAPPPAERPPPKFHEIQGWVLAGVAAVFLGLVVRRHFQTRQ
ncbi:MAG: hypothetical protein EOP88_07715 [Verrucomicrobiaceae bacterium]|nr:MAG: hypothetical protein EOP88_07715 [Verrucomicrobiaceae bacterium]